MNPPLSMREMAVGIHEYFVSLMEAGFTRKEALYIVGEAVKGANNGNE